MRLNRCRRLPTFVAIAFAMAVSSLRLAALEIEKLVPFAWTNNVRLELAFKSSDSVRDADLVAEIVDSSNHSLWSGKLGDVSVPANGNASLSKTISNLNPQLWSPSAPNLYTIRLSVRRGTNVLATKAVRFGFRSFENRNGQFFLNGHPIFLRGIAINPPGRTVPDEVGRSRVFAESYVRFMKSRNVNAIRLPEDSQVWFDVCDELGMMMFQGNYGSPLEAPRNKQGAPRDYRKSLTAYKQMFETYARHPSIMIYILSNELPTSGERGKAFHEFLTNACNDLKRWDPTRLYIGNAGYGEGREGDVKDVHRYWSWYYNTFLTFLNLRDKKLFGDPDAVQPVTFTECVGNYTGPRGDYNIIMSKQLGAQLNWTGHSTNQVGDALYHQMFTTQQATEAFRRLRPMNPRLAGVMPFSIFFYNWSGIKSFEDMDPKPAMEQLRDSYSPVLLSWEMWTPNVYAGTRIKAWAHVVNDDDAFRDITNGVLAAEVRTKTGKVVLRREVNLGSIRYFGTARQQLQLELPDDMAKGEYVLAGEILENGNRLARNQIDFFVSPRNNGRTANLEAELVLFDPKGATKRALQRLKIPFHSIQKLEQLSSSSALVIGEESVSRLSTGETKALRNFIDAGGRVLCLRQDSAKFDASWLPVGIEFFKGSANDEHYPPASRPFRDNMNINPERPNHPVFSGITRRDLSLWSDYTGYNLTKRGFPRVYPVTDGFQLKHTDGLAHTAVLANYDRGLQGVALAEMFSGKGSVVYSAFDIVSRVGLDPVADQFLLNLVSYTTSKTGHEVYPVITTPIVWGDYGSERGVITGPRHGMLVNADWIVPPENPKAKPLTQEEGAWNTRPSDQFVPHGRLLGGHYGYSTGSSVRDLSKDSDEGYGVFWLRLPSTKKTIRTRAENRSGAPTTLKVFINGKLAGERRFGAGETATFNASLPDNAEGIEVKYTGSKKLLMLETAFE